MERTSPQPHSRSRPDVVLPLRPRAQLQTLPVFPINMVLFPDGILPLRIFEPRYMKLVSRCLKEETCFVATLITNGIETGDSEFHTRGTTARIVDWDQGKDGILEVQAVGERIVEIRNSDKEASGLYVAEIEELPAREPVPVPMRHQRLAELVSNYLSELMQFTSGSLRPGDAHWLADRLCELLPLSLSQRQALLETADPLARLDALHHVIPQAASA